jgi:hypothetical protein
VPVLLDKIYCDGSFESYSKFITISDYGTMKTMIQVLLYSQMCKYFE